MARFHGSVMLMTCCICLFNCFVATFGATHWIVTEDGKIQSQIDSIFNLARPYDLVALLQQEQRAVMLETLKYELLQRKDEIDKNEDKDTGLEQRFYKTDSDCVAAGKPLPEFDLYISTVLPLENKGVRPEEHIDKRAPSAFNPQEPNCTEFTELDFSVHAFEHLEGMRDRHNLSGSPELGLKNAITHRDNVDDYGHLIYEALKKNKTSWVLYNMAAFYWRIKGEPYQVTECLRRALHYSPRMQKDVALISLANVLHRSRYSSEAAIVVHAALEVSKELNVNHFTLGNIYAVLAEYNKSVICFENTLKIQPDFEAAAKRKHAVICHAKLEAALEAQHRSLQRTLNELREYQKKHEYWQQQQEKLLTEQVTSDTKFEQRFAYEQLKVNQAKADKGEFCQMVLVDGQHMLQCEWGSRRQNNAASWQAQLTTAKVKNKAKGKAGEAAEDDYLRPTLPTKYSSRRVLSPEEESKLPYKAKDWPDKTECNSFLQSHPLSGLYPSNYLSPLNKGFEVKALLAEAQGLKRGMQHPLPWYPPVCISIEELPDSSAFYDQLASVRERSKETHRISDPAMKQVLLEHVDGKDVTEEEVGQRILTALKNNLGPRWILYNIAGLYWRVIGNVYQGVECLRRALHYAPAEYQDVPLLNLANMLYRWKSKDVDDAYTLMKRAISINNLEPELHFFLASLCAERGNMTGAVWHYEETLRQEPSHPEAYAMLERTRCLYKFHHNAQSSAPKQEPGSCSKPIVATNKPESIISCTRDNLRENCVVETPISGCPCGKQCGGTCIQTCHVAPVVQLDPATHRLPPSMLHREPCMDSDEACEIEREVTVLPVSDTTEVFPGDGDLSFRLEEISEYYRQKGLCVGEECKQLFVQCLREQESDTGDALEFKRESFLYHVQDSALTSSSTNPFQAASPSQQCMTHGHHKPHTKLEIVNGILHQRLIFISSPTELRILPEDCVIFSDGSKSIGCSREEFRPFIDENSYRPTMSVVAKEVPRTKKKQQKQEKTPVDPERDNAKQDINFSDELSEEEREKTWKARKEASKKELQDKLKTSNIRYKAKQKLKWEPVAFTDEEIIKFNPDPTRHVHKVPGMAWPSSDECEQDQTGVDFTNCPSTWVSPTTKNIVLRDHIDVHMTLGQARFEPVCDSKLGSGARVLTLLASVADPELLEYSPEDGLKETLQLLAEKAEGEPVQIIGTKIALALKKKPSDWVVSNLAVLYWRVVGNAVEAIKCIKVAYANSPNNAKNIALLSLSNILQIGGQGEDAVMAGNMALEVDHTNIATHFTLANIFAAKGDYVKAMAFYESTLALQPTLQPAKHRLHILRCYYKYNSQHMFIKSAYIPPP